jgi:hypothetical protein
MSVQLGTWWAVIAGALMMLLLIGVMLACAPLSKSKRNYETLAAQRVLRRTGRRMVALAIVVGSVVSLLYAVSPDAPDILDWTSRQITTWI